MLGFRFNMRRGPVHGGGGGGGTQGKLKHLLFGRTNFGTQPSGSDLTFGWAGPLNRFTYTMSGSAPTLHGINAGCLCTPYALHHFTEATGQEATDNDTVSWGTLASTWATANSKNVELIFLHAAVGQNTNSAVVASVTSGGLITLGVNPANNKQMQAQARLGVTASNAFQIGQTYSLTTASPVQTVTVTVQSIPSLTTIQTDYAGPAATGGSIFRVGDGTITFANRIFFESETDWAWATNFQNADARAFQAYRMGQIVADGSNGCFFDSHFASNMHWQSQEYGTTGGQTAYVNDLCTALALYRSTYPGTIYFPNVANFTTALDAQIADAAGGCQQEGGINLFNTSNFGTGGTVDFTIARLAAGTLCEVSTHPDFNTATPHAGIQGAPAGYTASGGNAFTTAADRAIMAEYAAMLTMVNTGQPKKLYFDPANDNWSVFPLSARWETGFETPLGEPADAFTPQKFIVQSGLDASGKAAHVYARYFTSDGTTSGTPTALVLFRRYDGNTAAYDATTAFPTTITYAPPPGKVWGVTDDTGAVTGSIRVGDTIQLWNPDAAILVPLTPTSGRSWFASPSGTSANAGTQASPWDLTTALGGGSASQIAAGDTVILRAGTYGTGAETITASVSGSATAPVQVKPFTGEHVILNLTQLNITGSNVWYINDSLTGPGNFEIMRSTAAPDGTDLIRMQDAGDGLKLIHLVVHDSGGVGISPQSETADHEVYGCVVYNNGHSALLFSQTGAYGHGIYPHGTSTVGQTRKILNNILFDQVGYGIHAFSDTGNLKSFDIENNISFMNGLGLGYDLLVGGQTQLLNPIVANNVALRNDGNLTATIGYLAEGDAGVAATGGAVTGNYLAGKVDLGNWDAGTLQFKNNTCVGSGVESLEVLFAGAAGFSGFTFSGNRYAAVANGFGEFAVLVNGGGVSPTATDYATIADWRTATGLDATSTFTQAGDLGTQVFLFPSAYVSGRGHLAIHNPSSAATVSVDISGVVTSGHPYAIYDVYDLWGTPILSGTYPGGTVGVPMTGTGKTPPAVVGGGFTPVNVRPVIGAYVVLQTA